MWTLMFLLWTTNVFEKAFKKELLCMAFKRKVCWTNFSIQALPRPKNASLNLGIHQFSYSEWLIHLKRHLTGSLYIEFKENSLSYFSLRESHPKPKIGMPNWDSHQCFCSKRLFYPKRHLKGNYIFCLKKNHSSKFFETRTNEI